MKLIAERQLLGDYGLVVPGDSFEVPDQLGEDFITRGLAKHYEHKDITPTPVPNLPVPPKPADIKKV